MVPECPPPNDQKGTVLVISLVILLAMTLIGITAMQTTVLEERMSGNMKDQNMAFQATEAGMREAQDWIETKFKSVTGLPLATSGGTSLIWAECKVNPKTTSVTVPSGDGTPDVTTTVALCSDGTTAVDFSWLAGTSPQGEPYGEFFKYTDSGGNTLTHTDTASMAAVTDALPRTIVEERYAPPPEFEEAVRKKGVVHYTATAAGVGGTAQARAVEQTTVSLPRL